MPLRQALVKVFDVFLELGQVTEVRVLDAVTAQNSQRHTAAGFFNDCEKLIEAVADIRAARGLYFIPNPIGPRLFMRVPNRMCTAVAGQFTRDTDITCRRWLPININPKRPAGVLATLAALGTAMAVRNEINRHLAERGWPNPSPLCPGTVSTCSIGSTFPQMMVVWCSGYRRHSRIGLTVRGYKSIGRPTSRHTACGYTGLRFAKGYQLPTARNESRRILEVPIQKLVVPSQLLEELAASVGGPNGQPGTNEGRPMVGQTVAVPTPVPKPGAKTESSKPTATQPQSQPAAGGRPTATSLPKVQVPGGATKVTDSARALGKLLGATRDASAAGGPWPSCGGTTKANPVLEVVQPAKFISLAEDVCQPVKAAPTGKTWEPTVLSRQAADAILNADSLIENLPPIKIITRCPVLLERDGHLVEVAAYDRGSGIYAGGKPVEQVSVVDARGRLSAVALRLPVHIGGGPFPGFGCADYTGACLRWLARGPGTRHLGRGQRVADRQGIFRQANRCCLRGYTSYRRPKEERGW